MAGPKFLLALNGSRYALTFNLGAWAAIKRRGVKVTELLGRFDDVDDFDALQELLHGMLWDNPHPPSFEDVGWLVTYDNLRDVRKAMIQVMQEDIPEREASEEARPPVRGTSLSGSDLPTDPSDSSPSSSGG